MRAPPKHLPESAWPAEDHLLFAAAYREGDIFDVAAGPGQHLSAATRKGICFAWRRWLGFLARYFPADLLLPAAERLSPMRLRDYVEHLRGEMRDTSVASAISQLYDGARLIAPDRDWSWLKALKGRLQALARPKDRFDHLVPPALTLDYGIELMDEALLLPAGSRREREVQYRDGLVIAVLSLWPIRRRSLAALTADRHLLVGEDRIQLLLFAEDTKSRRAESWVVPDLLESYFRRYMEDIRPALVFSDGAGEPLWPSMKGGALGGARLYTMVSNRMLQKFGRAMALHDFRKAAPTFLAMDAPDKIGLAPGVLQHAGPDVSDQHYTLARTANASRRHVATIAGVKARLAELKRRVR